MVYLLKSQPDYTTHAHGTLKSVTPVLQAITAQHVRPVRIAVTTALATLE